MIESMAHPSYQHAGSYEGLVSIKLCSHRDDIYVSGQPIYLHCNYGQRSVEYTDVAAAQSVLPAQQIMTGFPDSARAHQEENFPHHSDSLANA